MCSALNDAQLFTQYYVSRMALTQLKEVKRVPTGVEKLDDALEGGIPQGSWVVVTGEPGVGKSVLAMHFAYAGLESGEPVVYVTTEQEFGDVVKQGAQLGMDFSKYSMYNIAWRREPESPPDIVIIDIFGLLKIAKQMSEKSQGERVKRYAALDINVLIEAVREAYEILEVVPPGEERANPDRHIRLVIDSASAFWAHAPALARRLSYQLKISLHRDNVTTILTSQYAMTTKATFGFGLEHIADGVIHMWMEDVEKARQVIRYLIIKKMRFTNHARHAYRVDIQPGKGLVLLDLD